jgi:hypothetical protein
LLIVEGLELRPRRAGEVLDAALRLARRGFWRIAPSVVIGSVPLAILAVLVVTSASGDDDGSAAIGAIVVLAVMFPFSVLLLSGASLLDLYHVEMGSTMTRRAALWRTVKRVPALFVHIIVVLILTTVANMAVSFVSFIPMSVAGIAGAASPILSAILLIIVVIFTYLAQFAILGRFALGVPALVIDRDGPFKAISRSIALTRGQTWSIGVVLLMASLLSFALSLVITLPLVIVSVVVLPSAFTGIAAVVAYAAVALAAYTFFSALLVVLFLDGRVRSEGLDLEMTAERLGFAKLEKVGFGYAPAYPAYAPQPYMPQPYAPQPPYPPQPYMPQPYAPQPPYPPQPYPPQPYPPQPPYPQQPYAPRQPSAPPPRLPQPPNKGPGPQ